MPPIDTRIPALVAFAFEHLRAGYLADAWQVDNPHELRQLRRHYRALAARLVFLAGADTPSALIQWIDQLEQPTWREQIALN